MDMQVSTLAGDITKITLNGRFDILAAQSIDLHFSVIVGSHKRVIVDLEHVPMIASMGIRTLIIGAKTMRSKGGRMALLKPAGDVLTVLEDTGADTIIPIVEDLEAAVAVVSG
jgi:anti-sigma B factor antagonist